MNIDPLMAASTALGAYSGMRSGSQRGAPVSGAVAGAVTALGADVLFRRAMATGDKRKALAAFVFAALAPGAAGDVAGRVMGRGPQVSAGPDHGELGMKTAAYVAGIKSALRVSKPVSSRAGSVAKKAPRPSTTMGLGTPELLPSMRPSPLSTTPNFQPPKPRRI